MRTQGYKLALAVFGQPVAHSLSPRIHRLFGQQLGIDVDYTAIEAGIDELPDELAAFRAAGGTGANLTVPLKYAGLKLCAGIDRAARLARAVNTLSLRKDGWHGHNTDGAGLMLDFERLSLDAAGRRVLILGAGGAVAGLLGPLLERSPATVFIANRTGERAERLAERFDHLGPVTGGGLEAATGGAFDLVIQSTSAGHHGETAPIDRGRLGQGTVAYDLNYGPAHAAFAGWCQAHDLPVHDGLGMLVGQAALAFEIWSGQRPAMEPVLEQLRKAAP